MLDVRGLRRPDKNQRPGMRKPRFAQKMWAAWRGYFWVNCPLCGAMFGGHEWTLGEGSYVAMTDSYGLPVCPNCVSADDVPEEPCMTCP